MGSRACYRTALEFCKLLLSLDPVADPLGVYLMFDFYALRAQHYAWFTNFFDTFEVSKNLSQLPNIAYSVAVAHFYLATKEKETDTVAMGKADAALQKALIMFPGVLLPLLDKCSIEPDKKAMGHTFFLDAERK